VGELSDHTETTLKVAVVARHRKFNCFCSNAQNCRSTLLFVRKRAHKSHNIRSKALSEARLFAPTGAQTKHGNARTESPNKWLPEPPAVPRCAALSSGRQLFWRPLGRSTQSPGERTSQSETALR